MIKTYYRITNGESYYSHSRAFSSTFEPNFTRNESDAKMFSDKSDAQEIIKKLKSIGISDYKIVTLKLKYN